MYIELILNINYNELNISMKFSCKCLLCLPSFSDINAFNLMFL